MSELPNKNNKKNIFGDDNNPNNQSPQVKIFKNIIVWGILLSAFIVMFSMMNNIENEETLVSYSEYKEILNSGKISTARIEKSQYNDYDFFGELREPIKINVNGRYKDITKFRTKLGIINSDTEKEWAEKGINWKYEKSDDSIWNIIFSFLPWVVLIGIYIFFIRRMQGGAGGGKNGVFSFGKSKAKLLNENQKKITFADVAGADEAKYELEEIIEFLKEPKKFQRLGGKIPRGVLLLGPPGTGKTLLARAVAGESGVPFFSISGADFVEMFVGVGASRVRDLFDQAQKNSPCIVFIDEIDAVGRHRGAGLGGGHDEREQTLNQLLVEMDGFEQNSGVIVIAATNRPDVLDPALLRPGRFDRQIVVDRPDIKGREGILKVHTKKIPLAEDVDLSVLAKGTPGFSGADLANMVNEAALFAARRNSEKVTMYDFEMSKDKVMMGVERKSMVISDKEKESTAYHEMGHALVGALLPNSDPVHKISIIPRGRALGVTSYLPLEDTHSWNKDYIESQIVILLSGRAAEKIVFNQYSTGASNDLERATKLAKKMVCEWGMSEVLGPVNYGANSEEVFLGREIAQNKDHSEETALKIDNEIRRILVSSAEKSDKLLNENIDMLHKASKVLLERETLEGEELQMLMRGEELPPMNIKKLEALKSIKIDDLK